MEKADAKLFKDTYDAMTKLRLAGVEIVHVGEEGNSFLDKKCVVKFSIPEKVLINSEFIKQQSGIDIGFSEITSDELIASVKNIVRKTIEDQAEEKISDEDFKETCKFFCKVRKGEVWDEAKLMGKIAEIAEEIKKMQEAINGYKEV